MLGPGRLRAARIEPRRARRSAGASPVLPRICPHVSPVASECALIAGRGEVSTTFQPRDDQLRGLAALASRQRPSLPVLRFSFGLASTLTHGRHGWSPGDAEEERLKQQSTPRSTPDSPHSGAFCCTCPARPMVLLPRGAAADPSRRGEVATSTDVAAPCSWVLKPNAPAWSSLACPTARCAGR